MLKALSLSLILLLGQLATAAPLCRDLFSVKATSITADVRVLKQMDDLIGLVEKYELFEVKAKKRAKEIEHIRKDLDGVKKELSKKLATQEYFNELLLKWESFNSYWISKAKDFESLPNLKKKQLREYMDLPMSLAIKHFIAFTEAGNHSKWKLSRLNHLLTIHQSHPELSLEAALFLFHREVIKFQSRWDFTKCRY